MIILRRNSEHRLISNILRRDAKTVKELQRITSLLDIQDADRRHALARTLSELQSLAWQIDPGIKFYGRIKSNVSISVKMASNHLDINQVLDIIGIRAITQSANDCYRLNNLISSKFLVLGREYDDYIAVPKTNGYQSIHTTILSLNGFAVEIQIRTLSMQGFCERGPAAHSLYKKITSVGYQPLPGHSGDSNDG